MWELPTDNKSSEGSVNRIKAFNEKTHLLSLKGNKRNNDVGRKKSKQECIKTNDPPKEF
jgi:hypothetical protein